MPFVPDEFARDASPLIEELSADNPGGSVWSPLFRHGCHFGPPDFGAVMLNLVKNPNINSSWLFRADILADVTSRPVCEPELSSWSDRPRVLAFKGFQCERLMVRKLIPRNTLRDDPLDQTCLFYRSVENLEGPTKILVIYLPHVSSEAEVPFYHPAVRGIAFLHEWAPADGGRGLVSIHYLDFDSEADRPVKLARTALNLLSVVHKHGEGRCRGYVKRVQHDVVLPQARVQERYTALKQKYARELVTGWAESTDPAKHVFEDLCIAAFLVELWADMYRDDDASPSSPRSSFSGFVDIGCGNGLLVYILNREGYSGWGCDARARRSWQTYNMKRNDGSDSLRQLVLLPSVLRAPAEAKDMIHDGRFPAGTFIISNHADELTPWTPILAAISRCPFIMIPCCGHDLGGAKFRPPAPKGTGKMESAYASLVTWVSAIAADCGWEVEREMLRIPSTRNAAIIGRRRVRDYEEIDINDLIVKYGGTGGYLEHVTKLVKNGAS